jgi:beta-lactamase class A
LACDVGSEEAFPEFAPLKQKLTNLIDKKVASGDAQDISVYLRSLNNARWFEIYGAKTYAPASLLKTFVMMAYYREADATDNPRLLQQQIPFISSVAYGNNTENDAVGGAIVHLTGGKLYTVDEIIDQMIIYSDNDAYATLLNNFDPQTVKALETISTDLDIPLPVTRNENSLDFMSADDYAMIFRVLFGSTYLSERYSEKALQLLSQAKYTTGIVAGVPANLTVAHKYGIKAVPVVSASTPNELHDCGIVYYPNHPYLLCIMTRGKSLPAQQTSIKDISATAYQWLDAYYKTFPPSSGAPSTPSTVTP